METQKRNSENGVPMSALHFCLPHTDLSLKKASSAPHRSHQDPFTLRRHPCLDFRHSVVSQNLAHPGFPIPTGSILLNQIFRVPLHIHYLIPKRHHRRTPRPASIPSGSIQTERHLVIGIRLAAENQRNSTSSVNRSRLDPYPRKGPLSIGSTAIPTSPSGIGVPSSIPSGSIPSRTSSLYSPYLTEHPLDHGARRRAGSQLDPSPETASLHLPWNK